MIEIKFVNFNVVHILNKNILCYYSFKLLLALGDDDWCEAVLRSTLVSGQVWWKWSRTRARCFSLQCDYWLWLIIVPLQHAGCLSSKLLVILNRNVLLTSFQEFLALMFVNTVGLSRKLTLITLIQSCVAQHLFR